MQARPQSAHVDARPRRYEPWKPLPLTTRPRPFPWRLSLGRAEPKESANIWTREYVILPDSLGEPEEGENHANPFWEIPNLLPEDAEIYRP